MHLENTTALAKIEVQQTFCAKCSFCLKQKLEAIKLISGIRLYPKDALITFNFNASSQISSVLNLLADHGYYEKEEHIGTRKTCATKLLCTC